MMCVALAVGSVWFIQDETQVVLYNGGNSKLETQRDRWGSNVVPSVTVKQMIARVIGELTAKL
jgi:hypothetical protein